MLGGTHLANASIGYEPLIGVKRQALAMRLKVAASESTTLAGLYRELSASWGSAQGTVLISSDSPIGEELMSVEPLANLWFEVPASMLDQVEGAALVHRLHAHGFQMVLRGAPAQPLPAVVLRAFRMSVIDVADDRRLNTSLSSSSACPTSQDGLARSIPYVQAGVRSIEQMQRSFATGAHAIAGWPIEDTLARATSTKPTPAYASIVELIGLIDQGEDPMAMEQIIRRDASLAYRLLRYINSPGFGLAVEVQSFRHAVMMLGYTRLKRWLALCLATASSDVDLRPVMVASFRRAVFLEHLIVGSMDDAEVRDEVFILGVFSLLDKLLHQPFEELFARMRVPARIVDSLIGGSGPYTPYLRLAEAIEVGPGQIDAELNDCVVSLAQCNQAVLRALSAPDLVNI